MRMTIWRTESKPLESIPWVAGEEKNTFAPRDWGIIQWKWLPTWADTPKAIWWSPPAFQSATGRNRTFPQLVRNDEGMGLTAEGPDSLESWWVRPQGDQSHPQGPTSINCSGHHLWTWVLFPRAKKVPAQKGSILISFLWVTNGVRAGEQNRVEYGSKRISFSLAARHVSL